MAELGKKGEKNKAGIPCAAKAVERSPTGATLRRTRQQCHDQDDDRGEEGGGETSCGIFGAETLFGLDLGISKLSAHKETTAPLAANLDPYARTARSTACCVTGLIKVRRFNMPLTAGSRLSKSLMENNDAARREVSLCARGRRS